MDEGTKLPVPGDVPETKSYLTREERKQLDALSKALSGKSSHWKKAIDQGYTTEMEEKLEDGTIRKYKGIKYPTTEEVKKHMEDTLQQKLEKEKLEAEKKQKAESEKALDTMVAENQKLGLYDEVNNVGTESQSQGTSGETSNT